MKDQPRFELGVPFSAPPEGGERLAPVTPRSWLWMLLILPGALLGVGVFLFFRSQAAEFPSLPPGFYGGSLQMSGGEPLPLFIEQREGKEVEINVVAQGWMPVHLSLDVDASIGGGAIVVGPNEAHYRLTGVRDGAGGGRGDIVSTDGSITGVWSVKGYPGIEESADPFSHAHTLMIKGERFGVDRKKARLEQEIEEMRRELEAMQIRESGSREQIEREVRDRLVSIGREELALQDEVAKLTADLAELQTRAELSLSLTPAGKLVRLARQVIERENQWAQISVFSSPFADPALDPFREKYQKVRAIERAIKGNGPSLESPAKEELEPPAEGAPFQSVWEER